jgi:hypothetical protein
MLSEKKYDLLLEFFKKELSKCDVLTNDTNYNCWINCYSREWVIVVKTNEELIYYNPKYFNDFLFKIFDVPEYDSIGYPYLIKKLLFNSIDVLNKIFYNKFEEGYIKNKILTSIICGKIKLHPESINMMFERIKEQNYDGDFIK